MTRLLLPLTTLKDLYHTLPISDDILMTLMIHWDPHYQLTGNRSVGERCLQHLTLADYRRLRMGILAELQAVQKVPEFLTVSELLTVKFCTEFHHK